MPEFFTVLSPEAALARLWDHLPPTLAALHGLPASMKACPASGTPYAYNPQTGEVHCVTPGHERL